MSGFSFPTFTPASVKSMNCRAEMHGTDPVPAIDLGLRITGTNEMLRMFGVGWLIGHYVPADSDVDEEPELDGIEALSPRPKLRFAAGRIDIPTAEYSGVTLVIDYGLGGKSNIELFGDANKFSADLKDGGSIVLDFRFQVSGVKDSVIGKLGSLVRHDVQITALRSAEADGTQENIEDTKTKPLEFEAGAPPVDAKDATQVFAETHGKPASKKAAAKKTPTKPAMKKAATKKTNGAKPLTGTPAE